MYPYLLPCSRENMLYLLINGEQEQTTQLPPLKNHPYPKISINCKSLVARCKGVVQLESCSWNHVIHLFNPYLQNRDLAEFPTSYVLYPMAFKPARVVM